MTAPRAAALLHRWAPAVTAAVVAADALLLATGTITGRGALTLFLAVEAPLVAVTATVLAVAVRAHLRRGDGLPAALGRVAARSPAAALVRAELRSYRALWMWLRRRCDVPAGAVALPARRGTAALPAAFAVAMIVEMAALDLLLPWPWLRIAVAAVSLWSLAMLGGIVALGRTRPHYVSDRALVLRSAGRTVAAIDLADVAAAASRRRWSPTTAGVDGTRLSLPNQDGTRLDIALRSPVPARLAAWPRRARVHQVDTVSLHLDDPAPLLAALARRRPGCAGAHQGPGAGRARGTAERPAASVDAPGPSVAMPAGVSPSGSPAG